MKIYRLLLTTIIGVSAVAAWAVPARRVFVPVKMADGTTVMATLAGDEHCHYYVTEDGLPLLKASDGTFTATTAGEITGRAARAKAKRTKRVNSREEAEADTLEHVPTLGIREIPLLLVQYPDAKFIDESTVKQDIEANVNGHNNKSVGQYFRDMSQGKYDPRFHIFGPVTLPKNRAAYGGNTNDGNDRGVGQMVVDAVDAVDAEVDFSKYDTDGDGMCDAVVIIYAGEGENSGLNQSQSVVWPQQWYLDGSDYGKAYEADGVGINNFAVFNEASRDYQGGPLGYDGIGTFVHEFSHALGLPDLYSTGEASRFGMDVWSVMDFGCYNDNSHTPLGYSAYEKSYLGWLKLEEPQGKLSTTLTTNNSYICVNEYPVADLALALYNDVDRNEYFVLESRARKGWDEFMPADGLMITHITYDAQKWYDNTVNNDYVQCVTLVPADDNLRSWPASSLDGDLYPYGGNNQLTDTSRPAAKTNLGGGTLHKPVTNIVLNLDLTVSLDVDGGEVGIPEMGVEDCQAEYYDLQGRRIDYPANGIYIKKQGAKVTKVMI